MQHSQQIANVDLVADFDFQLLDDARVRGRNFHRRFVRLDGDQGLLDLHGVAGLDENFNDGNVFEIADVGDADVDQGRGCRALGARNDGGRYGNGRRSGRRGGGCRALRARNDVEGEDDGAFGDFVAELHFQLFHHAGMRRGNFHRGFVGLDSDQRLLGRDGVARLDQQLDDGHFTEIPNVGDFDFYGCHVLCLRAQAYKGLILSVLMPYFWMASATLVAGTAPSSLSALSAAITM